MTAPLPRFVTGSILRHVVTMTAASSVGLAALFAVDIVSLFYISLLGRPALTAAIGYAGTLLFFCEFAVHRFVHRLLGIDLACLGRRAAHPGAPSGRFIGGDHAGLHARRSTGLVAVFGRMP